MSGGPKPMDHAARERAATDLDTTLFVEAAAGTGKTTTLVARILHAVTTGRARLHEIVAITFTEKAAGELKVRVRAELEKQLRDDPLRAALGDLERAQITTIHSFCASILRERPVEAVVDPQFGVADTLQRELLRDAAWAEWREAELARNPAALRHALFRDVRMDDLAALAALLVDNRARLAAACWPAPLPLPVRDVLPRLRAAVPVLDRCLPHCPATTGNFHQRARLFCDTVPHLEHATDERVVAVLTTLELTASQRKADFDSSDAFAEVKKAIQELKAVLAGFATAADHNFLIELVGWLQGFVAHFQRFKHAQAVLDFDDLLEKTRDLLRDNAAVRTALQQRYRFVLVDEFQDTDPVQTEIVLALGGGQPGKLFIVGDPKQSIYGFRRADIEMYAGTRRALEPHGRVLQFQQNFRSRSTILDWVNIVFARLIQRPVDGDYQPEYIALAPTPKFLTAEPRVTLLRPAAFPDKQPLDAVRRAEAEAIAGYLRRQVAANACRWGDVALLFRSFTGVEVYADVFLEQGVPYRLVGGRGYYQRQEIQTLGALLCCLDNPNDKLNLVAVLRSAAFGWTDEQLFLTAAAGGLDYLRPVADIEEELVRQSFTLLRELHECRQGMSVAAFVAHVCAQTHLCQAFVASGPDGAASVANLLKALELARQLEAAGVRSLRAFVRQLRRTVASGLEEEPAPANEETDDVVRLMTMHKAKGLEFPVVVLADLASQSSDSGARLVAHRARGTSELRFGGCRTTEFAAAVADQDKRDEAEEIRLLYVAATRAKERLVITWFKEKGERLDLLRRGFEPVAGPLGEVPELSAVPVSAADDRQRDACVIDLIRQRQAWQTEQVALLARAAQPLPRVSPSKLGAEAEPREEEPAGRERKEAMEFGVLVHEALERGDAAGLPDKARAMVERALQSGLLRRAQAADEVYRELPFTVPTPAGLMEGKIDLLFREGGRWVLVDYKTDAQPEPSRYRAQMQAYTAALRQVAGIAVAEVLLFFVATGTVAEVTA